MAASSLQSLLVSLPCCCEISLLLVTGWDGTRAYMGLYEQSFPIFEEEPVAVASGILLFYGVRGLMGKWRIWLSTLDNAINV